MIFIDNKYTRWYYAIISIAKNRAKTRNELLQLAPNYIIEKHHIIPESFFLIRKRNPKNPGWIDGDADKVCPRLTKEKHLAKSGEII